MVLDSTATEIFEFKNAGWKMSKTEPPCHLQKFIKNWLDNIQMLVWCTEKPKKYCLIYN